MTPLTQQQHGKSYYQQNRIAILAKYKLAWESKTPEEKKLIRAKKRERYHSRPRTAKEQAAGLVANKRHRENNKAAYRDRDRGYMLKKYGLTPEGYDQLLGEQNGLCACCLQPPIAGKRLVVDHCHKTGVVRGLLHDKCNLGLGQLGDSIERLRLAVQYLERNP